jgi:hypothetical protein
MPVTFETHDHRCMIRLTDLITLVDVETGLNAQIHAGAWARQTIVDTTEATGIDVPFTAIEHLLAFIARRAQGLPTRGPVAIVAPAPAVYGLARLYQRSAEAAAPRMTVEVVRSRRDAEAWLDRLLQMQ